MAGEANSPRVGQALPVANQQIGTDGKPLDRFDGRWYLAKAEQSGHIGKSDRDADDSLVKDRKRFKIKNHGGGMSLTIASFVGDIDTGDGSERAEIIIADNSPRQVPLLGNGLSNTRRPRSQ